jgi:hypothetical protein
MILKQILASAVLLASFTTVANAENCDFSKLNFGINQAQLKSDFKLETLDVATTGEATIPIGAAEICKDLPNSAVVEFMLIDDKFVQMGISNKNTSHALYTYAIKLFGERDNKDKDATKPTPLEKIKLGLWSKSNEYSVVYKAYSAGNKDFEKILITSKQHKDLFSSANKAKSQAADDYLRENNLGKYSPNSTDRLENESAQNAKIDSSDRKIPKNKKLKENEHSRGYHYEDKEGN